MDDPEGMQRFTATGRPYSAPSKAEKHQMAISNIDTADSFGAGPANLLPRKYTDDSLISVPCLRPEDIGKRREINVGPIKGLEGEKDGKRKWWHSRRRSKDGAMNENFIIRKMPRGEYLKHYAKDDEGRYCGTEEPADDCLLRGEDLERYRGPGHEVASKGFRHEIEIEDGGVGEKAKEDVGKKPGFMARFKNELNEGIEHGQERRDAAPKLTTRGVVGIGLGAGMKF